MGAFLVFTEFQGNLIVGNVFNCNDRKPFSKNLALAHYNINYMNNWFVCITALTYLKSIIFLIVLAIGTEVGKATKHQMLRVGLKMELATMGKIALAEKFMIGIFVVALTLLWIVGSFIHIDATLTAFIALALLLLTGVLTSASILNETGAWNTFVLVLSISVNGRPIKQAWIYSLVK